jgi:hypothetical protein
MSGHAADILRVLDSACESFTFPMLDNGYFYLAATRLSLFGSPEDWAVVFEVFGFSPREGTPSTVIQTFASRLPRKNHLINDPHYDFRSVYPLGQIDWEDAECVADGVREVTLRGRKINLPELDEYERHGIELIEPDRVRVFEACRYLAGISREDALATKEERRVSVLPEMKLDAARRVAPPECRRGRPSGPLADLPAARESPGDGRRS